VYTPSANSIWYKGRTPGIISWTGGGQAIRVELYEGDRLINELTNGWSDNEHSLQIPGSVGIEWDETPFYRIHVISMGTASETLEGWSDYFSVEMSNDLIQGAGVLEHSVTGTIDFNDDVDYFSFVTQGRWIHEFCVEAGSGIEIDLIGSDSSSVVRSFGSGGIEWIPDESNVYFLRISSTDGSESDYTISLSRRLPPERVRRFQVGGWYGLPLTSMKDVIPSGYGAFVSYSPIRFLDVGAEWVSLEVGEDIDYFNILWGRQSFVGGYVGLVSPDFSGVRARAGAGYFIRMNSEEILLKSQYASYADALSDGIKWYAGIDYKLFSSHFGAALYTRLQYNALNSGDGLVNLGLTVTF
jgi:hypothetical protein